MLNSKARAVFESYNLIAAGCYDRFFEKNKDRDIIKDMKECEAQIKKSMEKEITRWEHEVLAGLDGLTPVEFFKSLEDIDTLMEVFKLGARLCDDDLPEAFQNILKSYGNKAVDALLELACDRSLARREDDELLIPLMAAGVLGEWQAAAASGPLIDMLIDSAADNEVIGEGIKNALIGIGKPSLENITAALEAMESIGDAGELLMTALADIGRTSRSDRIYRCLKSAFIKMNNKVVGAICLGEYGDGRAIPALRGFVERNLNHIDRETFYEIKHAVERLGGNMSDLRLS